MTWRILGLLALVVPGAAWARGGSHCAHPVSPPVTWDGPVQQAPTPAIKRRPYLPPREPGFEPVDQEPDWAQREAQTPEERARASTQRPKDDFAQPETKEVDPFTYRIHRP